MTEQVAIPCTLMRGGTSKGVYLNERDIPPPGHQRDHVLKRIMGTPDIMQIDGLGGGRLVTSKIAILARSERPDADIDYTFAQVDLDRDIVSYEGNCGNISVGVGPFAIDNGLVAVNGPVTEVLIRNTNTEQIFSAYVGIVNGRAKVDGDLSIPGVPGTGAEIFMDFKNTVGSKTGKILPTGNLVDRLVLEDSRSLEVSIVDAGNPCVFIRAADVGLTARELPEELAADPATLELMKEIRGKAAEMLGWSSRWNEAEEQTPLLPLPVLVAPPVEYMTLDRKSADAASMDICARLFFLNRCHESMAATGAICIAAASRLRGTIVEAVTRPESLTGSTLRIGHPLGVMPLKVSAERSVVDGAVTFLGLGIRRTARRIMDGFVYLPQSDLNGWVPPPNETSKAAGGAC